MYQVSKSQLGLKQFRHEGCFSYIVFDRSTQQACFIDPRADRLDDYQTFVGERGLRPVMALDTHLHSDHFSATHLLREALGVKVLMSAKTESARPHVRLSAGDSFHIGKFEWKVLETPGHTLDSLSIYGNGLLFTGDTLLISASGQTDSGEASGMLWESLQFLLDSLPGATLVFPGHDSSGLLFSSLEIEKAKNPHCQILEKKSFAAFKEGRGRVQTGLGGGREEFLQRYRYNLAASPQEEGRYWGMSNGVNEEGRIQSSTVTSIHVEKYAQKVAEKLSDCAYIDVRETEEFELHHIPGTWNLPVSEVPFFLGELRRFRRVYVSCLSGRRSLMVANTLDYLGLPDVVNVLGGIQAWIHRGLPLSQLGQATDR